MKKKKKKSKIVIQKHHIIYGREDKKQADMVRYLRRTEHFLITRINRLNPLTHGFLDSLEMFIKINRERAVGVETIKNNFSQEG